MHTLSTLPTPALLLDRGIAARNMARMQGHLASVASGVQVAGAGGFALTSSSGALALTNAGGIETMVGLFINTIPVRITLRPSESIGTLLARIQADPELAGVSAVPNTAVDWLDNMPPLPWAMAVRAPCTWRAPPSPRSWRTASITANTPYMPGCTHDRPPPLVLTGSRPPGAVCRSPMKAAASPGRQKPRSSRP